MLDRGVQVGQGTGDQAIASAASWERVQEIFEAVVHCEIAERSAKLDQACGNDEALRRDIESLLAGHERAGVLDGLAEQLSAPALWRARIDAMEQQGRRVAHYDVLEQLGAGGMGFVYKALDVRLNRRVALKFLPPQLGMREDAKRRFMTEARAAARLDHVNICTIHEIGETPDGQLFIAMPLYEGETLQQRLERAGALAFAEAANIALQVAAGLAKAHEHGIVHRDIKPSNIILLPDGCVKILDFGIARVDDALLATHDGGALGTLAYMSPEQARGERVDVRTDVWSLGVVLYEMLAGERPFQGDDARAVRSTTLMVPRSIGDIRADVPREVDALLATALASTPEARYPTMSSLARELGALLDDERSDARLTLGAQGAATEVERRRAAVLVCRLSSYAALLEQLLPPRLEELVREIRAAAVEVVRGHGGLVNQTLEDEIVAVFGAPATHEDDELRAVRAAMDLLARIHGLSAAWNEELAMPILMQCGLHSGALVARRLNYGPQRYALNGLPVQAAARLAALSPPNAILISQECARLVAPFVVVEEQEQTRVVVDAESAPIVACRVVGVSGLQTRIEAAVRKGLTPLAGRGPELAMIEAHCVRACAGEGQVVLLIGEAGVGKSRLLYELRERICGLQVQILQARCRSYGEAPYMPFTELLRETLHVHTAGSGEATAVDLIRRLREIDPTLEQFAALYLHLLSIPSEPHALPRHLRGEHLRESVSEALAAILIALARTRSTIFLLEDWHWSDEGSNETLLRLLEIVSANPMLILIASRPEGVARLTAAPSTARIQLSPLDFDSCKAIMRSVLGLERVSNELARRVYERSGGNPFFIEEVCQTLIDQGIFTAQDSEGAVNAVEGLHIPETVQAVLRTRLDGLDKDTLEVLRVASVIGREFTQGLLLDALGSNAHAARALDRLKAVGLIQQVSVVPEVSYRFKHALTQEVTYDSLLSHQKRALHEVIGRAIESQYAQRTDERADLLAYHFGRAECWEQAVRYGRRAADRASALSQFAGALAMLDRVQMCLTHVPDDTARRDLIVDVLLQQERLCETLGQRKRQQQLVIELIALLAPHGASAKLALAYLRQGDLLTLLRRFDAADRALSTSLRMSRERGDAALERHALRSLGLLRWHEGRHEEALVITQNALAIDRERGDRLAVAGDLVNLGVIFKSMGDYTRALASFEDGLSTPELAQDPSSLVYSLHNVANVYRELGDLDRAREYLERANEVARAHLMPIQRSFHLMAIAHILFRQGHIDQALQTYRDSIELSRRAHHADGLVQSLRALGEVLLGLQRDEEAAPLLEEAAARFAGLEDRASEVEMLSRVATIVERSMQPERALETWGRVRALYAELGDARGVLTALEGVARSARKSGAPRGEAIAHTSAALALASTLGETRRELALLNTLGILEWESGHYEEAMLHYEIALALARDMRDRGSEGLLLNSLAVTLSCLDRGEEARTVLEQSIALNRETGEQLLEAHALTALGDIHRARRALDAARECFECSLALRRTLGDTVGERHVLQRLASVEAVSG
jgi:tetratricopeptide (TPR) repeat protein/class 3 adenylate cyclase